MANSQINKRHKGKSKFWKDFSLSERITWIATIVGLVVDIIAILQLMGFFLPSATSSIFKPSPTLAVWIWFLAFFTYFALMHSYWEKHYEDQGLANSFSGFIFTDLLLNFKKPFYLLVLILLISIAFPLSALIGTVLTGILGGLCFVAIILIVAAKFASAAISWEEGPNKNSKKEIEDDWDFWENRIKVELERKVFVQYTDFKDVAETRHYDMRTFWYILALYATKKPQDAKFGALWKRQDEGDEDTLVDVNILVDLDRLNKQKYYVT